MNATREFITFSPSLRSRDPLANYWLQQVTVRLRREICWRWHLTAGTTSPLTLPPASDRLTDALDLSRYWEEKCQFYQSDPTAKYLTEKLAVEPPTSQSLIRGSFNWVVEILGLDEVSTFMLALGLIVSFDNAASEVIAACLNNATANHPTLALAQKLWEQPEEVLAIADPEHSLWRYGLLQAAQDAGSTSVVDWHSPLIVPTLVANQLLFPRSSLPQVLVPLAGRDKVDKGDKEEVSQSCTNNSSGSILLPRITESSLPRITESSLPGITESLLPEITESSLPEITESSLPGITESSLPGITESSPPGITESSPPGIEVSLPDLNDRAQLIALRLRNSTSNTLQILPIQALRGSVPTEVVRGIAHIAQREVVELQGNLSRFENSTYLQSLLTLCWLKGLDLFIPNNGGEAKEGEKSRYLLSLPSIPMTIFLSIRDRKELTKIPHHLLLPIIEATQLSYRDRVRVWQQTLNTTDPILEKSIAECSRRFRYEKGTIQNICKGLRGQINETDLIAACRAELDLDIGELAQAVTPRFTTEELVLPPKQQALFEDIYRAMKSLTEVHYEWGTGKAWSECGISVLFAGLPGTGKTMAAEILAAKLELPMYRIDLSQVVNKYIGETEKNLKRLFDAADISDTLLFFDEADALFGRRTEVKDAHDRYANLEISYLLERMERFKGLAILATNRKKDLDEAFLRRLRYIVDFPLPDVRERQRIWQQAIPEKVDASELNFEFLAKQFPLAGGNIRSIIFNACLQTAGKFNKRRQEAGGRRQEAGGRRQKLEDRGQKFFTDTLAEENPKLTMEQVVICIKREYDKLNRSVSLEQFGAYAKLVERGEFRI